MNGLTKYELSTIAKLRKMVESGQGREAAVMAGKFATANKQRQAKRFAAIKMVKMLYSYSSDQSTGTQVARKRQSK